MKELLRQHVKEDYIARAKLDSSTYWSQSGFKKSDQQAIDQAIEKVYDFSYTFLQERQGKITEASVKSILNKLPKAFDANAFYTKLLRLVLLVIEQKLKYKTPELPGFVEVKPEQPIVTLDHLLDSPLHKRLYESVENVDNLVRYLRYPKQNVALLLLWLCLKEGLTYSRQLQKVVNDPESLTKIGRHWLFEDGKKRYWLSSTAELLIAAWRECGVELKGTPQRIIEQWVRQQRLVAVTQPMQLKTLKEAYKLESLFKTSSIELGLTSYMHSSTHLPKLTLYRVLTGKRPTKPKQDEVSSAATVRQKTAWLAATAISRPNKAKNYSALQTDSTVRQQLELVKAFTARLENLPQKPSYLRVAEVKFDLRQWLESEKNAAHYPWVWVLLSWLYKLLVEGGKHKKNLKLTTSRSYVDYVTKPFLVEFSGCAPHLMSGEDWAQKFNLVAEQISASTKKAFVVYFAEFVIESGLAPSLCLSDLDIPVQNGEVNANLLTQAEADKVLFHLESLTGTLRVQAQIVFSLGFYAGLRRGEILGLQYKDFNYTKGLTYLNLHVRPNKFRSLKTPDSARNLPLDALISRELRTVFVEYLMSSRVKGTKLHSKIFPDENGMLEVFDIVTKVMQGVTGDSSLRFHHCRHSFCNWTWLRLNYTQLSTLKLYSFVNHHYFDSSCCRTLLTRLGIDPFSRKRMWALSILLGHASPDTSMSSYFHLTDFMRRVKLANHPPGLRLLRTFWGQKVQANNLGQIEVKPSLEQRFLATAPTEFRPQLHTDEYAFVQEKKHEENSSDVSLDLTLIWRIMRRIAEGQSTRIVAEDLGVTEKLVEHIVDFDQMMTNSSPLKSKTRFRPMVNYHRLSDSELKDVQKLINRFEYANKVKDLAPLNLPLLLELSDSFVAGKDYLIRTAKTKPVLTLLRLIKLMRIDSNNVKLKWYFPNGEDYEQGRNNEYFQHYLFWAQAARDKCELTDCDVECILPKQCAENFRAYLPCFCLAATVSDDGRFLPYHAPGFVSVHVLFAKEGDGIARRGKAFVTFMRLVLILENLKLSSVQYNLIL